MLIILVFVLGVAIGVADAKTSGGKSTGKTISVGAKPVKSKPATGVSLSTSFQTGKLSTNNAFLGSKLSVPSLGITDVSGFDLQSVAAGQRRLGQQLASDPSFRDTSFADVRAGPTAIGNALSIPLKGVTYSTAFSSDGAGLNVFVQTPRLY